MSVRIVPPPVTLRRISGYRLWMDGQTDYGVATHRNCNLTLTNVEVKIKWQKQMAQKKKFYIFTPGGQNISE